MELIPELFLLLMIFVILSSGLKFPQSTDEITVLVDDNPSYGATSTDFHPVNTDGYISTVAQKAANEAKDARQHLADKALNAANPAEEVLALKLLVEGLLESELRAGMLVVQMERKLLQTTKTIAAAAKLEAKESRDQVEALTEAVKTAQEYVAGWALVVSEAQQKVIKSRQIVDAAKKRFEHLRHKVEMARADFQNTKDAAEKAARRRQAELQAEAELDQETVHIPKLQLVVLNHED